MRVSNLKKTYGKRTLFQNLSFEIDSGLVLINGESGCGKSTILRILRGNAKPDEGEVFLDDDGPALDSLSTKERENTVFTHIAYAGQEPSLPDSLSPAQCEEVFLDGMDSEKLSAYAEQLDISSLKNTRLSSMSGGERMKWETAFCLASKAPILLLDEPFRSMDRTSVETSLAMINEVAKQKIVFLVDHGKVPENTDFSLRLVFSEDGLKVEKKPGLFKQQQAPALPNGTKRKRICPLLKDMLKLGSWPSLFLLLVILVSTFCLSSGLTTDPAYFSERDRTAAQVNSAPFSLISYIRNGYDTELTEEDFESEWLKNGFEVWGFSDERLFNTGGYNTYMVSCLDPDEYSFNQVTYFSYAIHAKEDITSQLQIEDSIVYEPTGETLEMSPGTLDNPFISAFIDSNIVQDFGCFGGSEIRFCLLLVTPDFFNVVLLNGLDTLVDESSGEPVTTEAPVWEWEDGTHPIIGISQDYSNDPKSKKITILDTNKFQIGIPGIPAGGEGSIYSKYITSAVGKDDGTLIWKGNTQIEAVDGNLTLSLSAYKTLLLDFPNISTVSMSEGYYLMLPKESCPEAFSSGLLPQSINRLDYSKYGDSLAVSLETTGIILSVVSIVLTILAVAFTMRRAKGTLEAYRTQRTTASQFVASFSFMTLIFLVPSLILILLWSLWLGPLAMNFIVYSMYTQATIEKPNLAIAEPLDKSKFPVMLYETQPIQAVTSVIVILLWILFFVFLTVSLWRMYKKK